MRFTVLINRWANFYFFVQNLSEWHFSNQKDYNILWRKELGQFSQEEEDGIQKFRQIRLRYGPGKTHFERAFFVSKDPIREIEKYLSQVEFQLIKNIFHMLENKFNALYKKDMPLLEEWQKKLKNEINNPILTKSIVSILNTLFKSMISNSKIKCYLLFSSPEHTGGGANIDEDSVTVEISRYPLERINQALGVVWHETTHLLFQNQYFYPLLLKYFSKNQKTADFVNEIIIGSLFPRGILGIRLLKNKPAGVLALNMNQNQTIEIMNLSRKYIDNRKSFDEEYIKELLNIIKI